jgi:glycosyltransferase involved in cell wall biosynthesis
MCVLWIDLVSELGGAQYSLLEVCGGLAASGVDIVAAVPRGPLSDALSAKGIPVYPVSPLRASKRGWGLFVTAAKLLRAPGTVAQIIRAVKPDIIHANSLPAFLAARKIVTHIPVVWHVRDLRLPSVLACNAAQKATRIIAASEAVDEYLADLLSPGILGRIRVIRNGIDPARFPACDRSAARQRFGFPAEAPLVGMVAHLVPWKRHDAFIDAAAAIRAQRPDAQFAAVGRDLFREHARWRSRLQEKLVSAGLEASFRWVTDCDDASHILPAFDLLLHPALHEPFGRVICEAMASSVPVIAAESGGPAAIIQPDVSGILVRDGNPRRMAEAALALLADPARAAALAAAGRDRVLKHFTTDKVCGQLVREYRTLVADTAARNSSDDD